VRGEHRSSAAVAGWFGVIQTTRLSLHERRSIMNWDTIKGQWKLFSGKVKQKWGQLTDDDLTAINGQQDQLVGKLQERYGYTKEKAQKELNDFLSASRP
jgi:uncharacterized protein YjbJ (UPF0337 family)